MFIESPRFPDAISYGCSGGPVWQTSVIEVASGQEVRNQGWADARHRYDVSHVYHDADGGKLKELRAFFMVVRGRLHAFRFKDWLDYQVTQGEGILIPVGTDQYQMYKRYQAGTHQYDRKISKPVPGTVQVLGSGTYTVDHTTGIVTRTAGNPPTGWTGEFDVPVRFETDVMSASLEAPGGYGHWQAIRLIEVRL